MRMHADRTTVPGMVLFKSVHAHDQGCPTQNFRQGPYDPKRAAGLCVKQEQSRHTLRLRLRRRTCAISGGMAQMWRLFSISVVTGLRRPPLAGKYPRDYSLLAS